MTAFDPSTIQAWSAVAIAFLTLVLVGATIAYVRSTGRLADEAKRTNDRAARNLERTLLMSAPSLSIVEGPSADRQTDGRIHFRVVLVNGGSAIATEIEVVSDYGSFEFAAALAPFAPVEFTKDLFEDPVGVGPRPNVTEFRFTDHGGTRYRQPVGGRPEVISS